MFVCISRSNYATNLFICIPVLWNCNAGLHFANSSPLFPELFPCVSWIIPLCFLNYSTLFPELFPSVSWIIPLCFLNYSSLFPELFPSVSWIIPLCFLNYSPLFPGFQSKQKNDRVIRSSVVKHNSLVNFRCAIPVVFIYTEGMCILSKSQHNLIFVFLLFKLTTCFGLCFRSSSDHRMCIIWGSHAMYVVKSNIWNNISTKSRCHSMY
jgi:hypothetical protein